MLRRYAFGRRRCSLIERVLEQNGLLAPGSDGDENDLGADHFFNAPNVGLRGFRQLGKTSNLVQRLLPSIQFFIDGLCAFHYFAACRELADEFSLITVRGTDGDFFEAGKDIELSQRNAGHAVHSYSVTHAHGIEPAAAPRTAGGGAKLGAFAPEGFTCLLYTSDAADERSSVDLGGR